MRDIGKRAAMHKGRVVLERLHQVGLHRACDSRTVIAPSALMIAAEYGRAVAPIGNDDIAKTLLQVFQIRCQAQDRHHL